MIAIGQGTVLVREKRKWDVYRPTIPKLFYDVVRDQVTNARCLLTHNTVWPSSV